LLARVDGDSERSGGATAGNAGARVGCLNCLLGLPPHRRPTTGLSEDELGTRQLGAIEDQIDGRATAAAEQNGCFVHHDCGLVPGVLSCAQNTRAASGQGSRAFSTRPSSDGSQSRYGSRLVASGLRATRKIALMASLIVVARRRIAGAVAVSIGGDADLLSLGEYNGTPILGASDLIARMLQ